MYKVQIVFHNVFVRLQYVRSKKFHGLKLTLALEQAKQKRLPKN